MIRIICVCGAKPNFMKIASVMRIFEKAIYRNSVSSIFSDPRGFQ